MDLTITDMWDAQRRLEEFPYVISLLDPGTDFPQKPEGHYIGRFWDSEFPGSGPTLWEIRSISDQVKEWGLTKDSKILIHCMAGVSRSTAVAWMVLLLVGYTVEEAKAILLQVRPQAWPNTLIIGFADALLRLHGELRKSNKALDMEVSERTLDGQSS
jgi:predicted protein tyrosine phosphatase